MGTLVTDWVWKRRTHHGVTAPMCEPSFWTAGDEDGEHAVSAVVATELAARATAEYERARTPAAAPAAKKTVKHKLVKHHEEQTTIVDDDDDDPDEDPDDDEEDDDEITPHRGATLAEQGRAAALRSTVNANGRLRRTVAIEEQTDRARFSARVIAAARGETGEPRFASVEDIDKQRAASGSRGFQVINGKLVGA